MGDPRQTYATPVSHGTLASHLTQSRRLGAPQSSSAGNWVLNSCDLGDGDHWAFLGLLHGRDRPRRQKVLPFYILFIRTSM